MVQLVQMEAVITAIIDEYPSLHGYQRRITIGSIFVIFLGSIPCITQVKHLTNIIESCDRVNRWINGQIFLLGRNVRDSIARLVCCLDICYPHLSGRGFYSVLDIRSFEFYSRC